MIEPRSILIAFASALIPLAVAFAYANWVT